jgi:hypothetical protein
MTTNIFKQTCLSADRALVCHPMWRSDCGAHGNVEDFF